MAFPPFALTGVLFDDLEVTPFSNLYNFRDTSARKEYLDE